ncbi:hypothetical protein [Curtobacterium sp. MCSS17_015]|uniref:hypothetical protein n=1 Tax=Curtobacterium sp. MCSS17_015 TaxID=2175666 RepID=UPI0015E88435|nr:hypothetical protein [Curtobacterium sp. MCSS17_015]WIB25798.1 hypothetical protein DEJ18_12170 [Curtobacterium sp. MCSS17_015]
MPDSPKTPHRTFRIPDDEYVPAQQKAAAEGTTLTAVVRQKLRDYVEEDDE